MTLRAGGVRTGHVEGCADRGDTLVTAPEAPCPRMGPAWPGWEGHWEDSRAPISRKRCTGWSVPEWQCTPHPLNEQPLRTAGASPVPTQGADGEGQRPSTERPLQGHHSHRGDTCRSSKASTVSARAWAAQQWMSLSCPWCFWCPRASNIETWLTQHSRDEPGLSPN